MNFYNKYILPRLINRGMQADDINKERAKVIPLASGIVLEIGGGSGTNLPFYKEVKKIILLEPSQELLKLGEERIRACPFPVEIVNASAEHIPLPDESVDTVVSTWTLCSIPDCERALAEIKRVLKQSGTFVFIEHGYSLDPFVAKWQTRLTPLWRHLAGGCHLDRKIDSLVKNAGLEIVDLKVEYHKGLRTAGYFYKGVAVRNH